MYKNILLRKNLSITERFKRLIIYYSRKRGAKLRWARRFKNVLKINPSYITPANESIENAHREYWKPFSRKINMLTMRVSKNISGIADPRYIPEEIFVADIEPTIYNTPSVEYLTYKSFYNRWFPGNIFPRDYFHNIDGEWLDQNLNHITFNNVRSIVKNLNYPVVLKPNRESYGGGDIFFPKNNDDLIDLVQSRKNIVIQEKISQHPFFNQFNHHGLNTLRVYIYRSVLDNKLHIVNVALRMGLGGSLDNETAGGILTMVRKDGYLNGFAVDKFGKKYLNHPDTGVDFKKKLPDYSGMVGISMEIAHKIFFARLIGLDLCYDNERNWRMIEINHGGAAIRFAQYHGSLFFGEFTDEVIDYCRKNHWAIK